MPHLGAIGDVKLSQAHRPALCGDFAGEFRQALGAAGADHDMGACGSQHLCRRLSDAAAGSGDGNDFPFDIRHFKLHYTPLAWRCG